jgi:hypothetical protein
LGADLWATAWDFGALCDLDDTTFCLEVLPRCSEEAAWDFGELCGADTTERGFAE